MKIHELSKQLNRISRTAMFLGQILLAVALSILPYILIVQSKQHLIPKKLNLIVSLALFALILCLGIYLFLHGLRRLNEYNHKIDKNITATKDAYEFYEYIKKKWRFEEIVSYIICGIAVVFAIFLIVITFNKVHKRFELWAIFEVVFIALGIGVYAIVSRVLRRKILKSFSVTNNGMTENVIKVESPKSIIHTIVMMLIFWVVVTVTYVFISEYLGAYDVMIIIWPIALCVFIAWLVVDFPFGKFSFITKNNRAVKIARIAIFVGLMFGLFYLMGNGSWYLITNYINDVAPIEVRQNYIEYDSSTGVYSITPSTDAPIRVLQITDVHIGGTLFTVKEDSMALDAVYSLVEQTRPDLIVVTGDAIYPMPYQTLSYNNHFPLLQFCAFMNQMEIPWAFTYGNHDTEVFATFDSKMLNELFELNAIYKDDLDGYMLFSNNIPDLKSRYNQYIEIYDQKGEIDRALFLMDSNSYISNTSFTKYDNFHIEQIKWYEDSIKALDNKHGKSVKSMVYFHIPMSEFSTAYQLLKQGSPSVKYLFGKIGEPNEAISYPYKEDTMFEKMLELRSTQAVFVGHDHLNDLGVNYLGIDLVYGKSIDYLAYPGIKNVKGHRGATLVTLLPNEQYTIEQISYVE